MRVKGGTEAVAEETLSSTVECSAASTMHGCGCVVQGSDRVIQQHLCAASG